MSSEQHDETTNSAGERLAEKLQMTDDDLAQMTPEELEEVSAKLKELDGALREAGSPE